MQKLKTRVIKKDVNPEWNEDLTLSVADPNLPVMLVKFLVCWLSYKIRPYLFRQRQPFLANDHMLGAFKCFTYYNIHFPVFVFLVYVFLFLPVSRLCMITTFSAKMIKWEMQNLTSGHF